MSAATPQNHEQARQDAAQRIAKIVLEVAPEVRWNISPEQIETSARAFIEAQSDRAREGGQ